MKYKKIRFFSLGTIVFITPIALFFAWNYINAGDALTPDERAVKELAQKFKLEQKVEKENQWINFNRDDSVDPKQLGIVVPEIPEGFQVSYKVAGVDQTVGDLYIFVFLKKQEAHKTLNLLVEGFMDLEKYIEKERPKFEKLVNDKKGKMITNQNTIDINELQKKLQKERPNKPILGSVFPPEMLGLDKVFTKSEIGEFFIEYRLLDVSVAGQIEVEIIINAQLREENFTEQSKQIETIYEQKNIVVKGFKE